MGAGTLVVFVKSNFVQMNFSRLSAVSPVFCIVSVLEARDTPVWVVLWLRAPSPKAFFAVLRALDF
jgi:hypothetical protein